MVTGGALPPAQAGRRPVGGRGRVDTTGGLWRCRRIVTWRPTNDTKLAAAADSPLYTEAPVMIAPRFSGEKKSGMATVPAIVPRKRLVCS